jgi:hypothetical protein
VTGLGIHPRERGPPATVPGGVQLGRICVPHRQLSPKAPFTRAENLTLRCLNPNCLAVPLPFRQNLEGQVERLRFVSGQLRRALCGFTSGARLCVVSELIVWRWCGERLSGIFLLVSLSRWRGLDFRRWCQWCWRMGVLW